MTDKIGFTIEKVLKYAAFL